MPESINAFSRDTLEKIADYANDILTEARAEPMVPSSLRAIRKLEELMYPKPESPEFWVIITQDSIGNKNIHLRPEADIEAIRSELGQLAKERTRAYAAYMVEGSPSTPQPNKAALQEYQEIING